MGFLDLLLFDGGAAVGAGTSPASEGSSAPAAGEQKQKVVFGKQPENAAPETGEAQAPEQTQVKTTSNTLEEKRAKFDELIRGEFKDLFVERTQGIIDKRFKETKNLESQVRKMEPLMNVLGQKYGVPGGDAEALCKAIDEDYSFFEEAAAKQGVNVEQFKRMEALKRENEGFRKAQEEAVRRQQDEQFAQRIMAEEQGMKQSYPGFSLQEELQNADFARLLKSGVSMQAAYQAIHMDELMTGAMQATASAVSKQVADNIRSRAERPQENGVSSQGGVVVKSDVSKLTPKDRREIARRVSMGEEIRF